MTRMLSIGLDNAKTGLTFSEEGTSEKVRIDAFFKRVQYICNTQIWGSIANPTAWECPYDAKDKTIGTICLDNVKTRRAMNYVELLLDVCIIEDRPEWGNTCFHYREAMEILRCKTDLSDEDIHQFQCGRQTFSSQLGSRSTKAGRE
jgi:hypothetical protein